MKKNITPNENKQDSKPVGNPSLPKQGGNINKIDAADREEFQNRKKVAKKYNEAEQHAYDEDFEILKENRISDSGLINDDANGTSTEIKDNYDGA